MSFISCCRKTFIRLAVSSSFSAAQVAAVRASSSRPSACNRSICWECWESWLRPSPCLADSSRSRPSSASARLPSSSARARRGSTAWRSRSTAPPAAEACSWLRRRRSCTSSPKLFSAAWRPLLLRTSSSWRPRPLRASSSWRRLLSASSSWSRRPVCDSRASRLPRRPRDSESRAVARSSPSFSCRRRRASASRSLPSQASETSRSRCSSSRARCWRESWASCRSTSAFICSLCCRSSRLPCCLRWACWWLWSRPSRLEHLLSSPARPLTCSCSRCSRLPWQAWSCLAQAWSVWLMPSWSTMMCWSRC
mmetsp:Transcript_18928/g.56754  ORF Transcript_18928/g.56754 Transcript_18928/m.56754 type:complete len:309 (-) Transcript_18928:1160-2086(-)